HALDRGFTTRKVVRSLAGEEAHDERTVPRRGCTRDRERKVLGEEPAAQADRYPRVLQACTSRLHAHDLEQLVAQHLRQYGAMLTTRFTERFGVDHPIMAAP